MGPRKVTSTKKSASGGKVFAPGCASKPDGESREKPEEHKRNEVELVDSVYELRSFSSIRGISMPNFQVLDARIASALNKIIHNSHFKRRISLEEQKAQKKDRFLRGRKIAYLIYDHYWNIDVSRDLSDAWTGFTQFTLLDEKAPDGYTWSGGRLTRKQLTSRPDHLWPELWKSMGNNAKLKEKQKWSEEKIHLENARKLRGMYFIDFEDTEFKETIKNARKKLGTSVAPALPCNIMKNCGSGGSDENKTKLACILEANESTRMRMGNSIPSNHEDQIAGKGENSLQHYNLVHKFIPMPHAMKILAAKAAVDKEWEKLQKISAWNLTKVKSKEEVIEEARMSCATVHFASLMDICHLKNAELEAKHQKYKGRVVLRGDIVKDNSGSYAVFTEPGSSASQMTAAKIMDIISRLSGCDGQVADAVSAKTQVIMEDAHK